MLHPVLAVGRGVQAVGLVDAVGVGCYDMAWTEGFADLEAKATAMLGFIDDSEVV